MLIRLTGTLTAVIVFVTLLALSFGAQKTPPEEDKPFGGPKDVGFAKKLWTAMGGYEDWKLTTEIYRGQSPHGKWLRLFSTWVTVEGNHYPIIVKDNYGGRGVTPERIKENRKSWLKAVTIMLQRQQGYDRDNQNWFWAKYGPDGTIEKNEKGMMLVGRVAKGMPKGCISCHAQAGGGDYLFSNDE